MLNINAGKNEAIAKKCGILAQYSIFIGKVRDFEHDGDNRQEVVKRAACFLQES